MPGSLFLEVLMKTDIRVKNESEKQCFFDVVLKENRETAGSVVFDDGYISFEAYPSYRGSHCMSEGLYLVTSFLHEHKGITSVKALVSKENETAVHILEHCGYQRLSENEGKYLYEHHPEKTEEDSGEAVPDGCRRIYLAGGCFWGTERIFRMLDGVAETCTGYANGTQKNPRYEDLMRRNTGYRETVRVTYDPSAVSLKTILQAYYLCVDPTNENGQAEDEGEQYKAGIYYRNEEDLSVIREVSEEERKKYDRFFVEIRPLRNFYPAEEYHQNYLEKIPYGYCHITAVDLEKVRKLNGKQ